MHSRMLGQELAMSPQRLNLGPQTRRQMRVRPIESGHTRR